MSSNINIIDKEWENFITSGFEDEVSSDDEDF